MVLRAARGIAGQVPQPYDRWMTSPTERADEYWATVFGVEPDELRRPGLHTTYIDDPRAGIYVLSLGETVRVRAPETRRTQVADVSFRHALDAAAWRVALRGSDAVVLGPAAHYLAGGSIDGPAEELHPDLAEVQRMVEGIGREEVEESGVLEPDVERFGFWIDGSLAAVSSLSSWVGGRTDVGLLVAPGLRGRGLGRKVAATALNAATRDAGIARWRCREDNAASVSLAVSLGLEPYGRNLGIRL